MQFLSEPEPPRGVATDVAPGVRRIVAPNPGPMTYRGTNTYLIDGADGVTVVDPGPNDAGHLASVQAAAGAPIRRILLSHGHRDHSAGVRPLQAATGAPVLAWHRAADPGFTPDHALHDGEAVDEWTALHTPGHAADHLAFARADGVVLTADHVMSFSSSIVSPPDGDMADYIASLRRLLARPGTLYLPGHGPPIHEPLAFAQALLDHRLQREAAVHAAITTAPVPIAAIVDLLYADIEALLRPAAARNVLAHLLKLRAEGRAVQDGDLWRAG